MSSCDKDNTTNGKTSQMICSPKPCCRTIRDFDITDQLGEGTFGKVYKARDKITGEYMALKKIRMEQETQGFPITAIREIKILKNIKNDNIVNLKEVIIDPSSDDVFLAFEFVDHDLSGLLDLRREHLFSKPGIVKSYFKQLLSGLAYLHKNNILHRDIKTSNLLINNSGFLKLGDFGLSRPFSEKIKQYTTNVITLWYRPPELLLKGYDRYSTEVDIWSVGCIFAELLCNKPIFAGKDDLDQLDIIFAMCGYPDEDSIKAVPEYAKVQQKDMYKRRLSEVLNERLKDRPDRTQAIDLIEKMLQLNPKQRITASQALFHDYFWCDPMPLNPKDIPYLGETVNEFTVRKTRDHKYKYPHQGHGGQHHTSRKYPPPQHSRYHPYANSHNQGQSGNYQNYGRSKRPM